MHLPDGAVSPMCAVYGAGMAALAALPAVVIGRREAIDARAPRRDPLHLGLAAAAVLAAQSFNVPVVAQASGHVLGGFLLAYAFGAAWGCAAMAAVLAVQTLLFGDGGAAALGLNIVNMAVIPCLVVYPAWRALAGETCGAARYLSVGFAAWASVALAALSCGAELLSTPAGGRQAGAVMGSMAGVHALAGVVEALATVGAVVVARRLAGMERARSAAVLGATAVLFVVAGALGSSPWPDGLETTLDRLALPAGGPGHSLFGGFGIAGGLIGCAAATAVVGWAGWLGVRSRQ